MNKKNFPIFISILIVSLFFTVVFYYAYTNMSAIKKSIRARNFYDARILENLSKREIDKLKDIPEIELVGGALAQTESANLNGDLISLNGEDLEVNKMRKYNHLISGRFPENNNEIVLDNVLVNKNNLKLGDKLSINLGNRVVDEKVIDARSIYTDKEKFKKINSKNYILVGVNKDIYNENLKIHYGLKLIDEGNELIPFIKFKDFKKSYQNREEIQNKIQTILGKKIDLEFNDSIVYYYGLNTSFSRNIITRIVNILSILLCVAIFVFFIKNIFWVWGIKKIRELSIYKSIGSTDFQIYKILLKEAIWISIIPIFIGHIIGFFLIKLLYEKSNSIKTEITFFENVDFNLILSLIIILVSMSVILFAIIFPAKKISKINIIDGIRGNFHLGKDTKKKRNKNIFKELRLNNLASIKSQRYISLIGIIIISIFAIIFSISKYYRDFYYYDDGYDLTVNYYNKTGETPKILQEILTEFDNNGHISKEKYIAIKNKLELSDEAKSKNLDVKLKKELEDSNKDYIEGRLIALDGKDLKKIGGKIGKFSLYNTVQEDPNEPISKAKRIKYFKSPKLLKMGIDDGKIIDAKIDNIIPNLEEYEDRTMPFEVKIYTDFENFKKLLEGNEKQFNYPFELKLKTEKGKQEETKKYIKEKIENSITYDESYNVYTKDELRDREYSDIESFKVIIYGIASIIFLLNITNGYSSINISLTSRRKEIGTLYSVGIDIDYLKKKYEIEFLLEQVKSFMSSIAVSIIFMVIIASLFKSIDFRNLLIYFPYLEFFVFTILVYGINYLIYKYSLKYILKRDPIELIK